MFVKSYIALLQKLAPWVFLNTRNYGSFDFFYAFFGAHDMVLLLIGFWLLRSTKNAQNRIIKVLGKGLYILSFVYLFPDFSATFETQRILYFSNLNKDTIDGFNLVYVWFRFPMFWLIGLIGLYATKFKKKESSI